MNKLLNSFLYWLSGFLRCRIILVAGQPYLERYFVADLFGLHVYLHRFLSSDDPAQGVHDHPWNGSLSLIPCGYYIEHRRWKSYPVRWVNFIDGDKFHRVELVEGVATWSLFFAWDPKPGRVWGMIKRAKPIDDRGDLSWVFEPYRYGAPGHNPKPSKWWETHPRGRFAQRERRDYVFSK